MIPLKTGVFLIRFLVKIREDFNYKVYYFNYLLFFVFQGVLLVLSVFAFQYEAAPFQFQADHVPIRYDLFQLLQFVFEILQSFAQKKE